MDEQSGLKKQTFEQTSVLIGKLVIAAAEFLTETAAPTTSPGDGYSGQSQKHETKMVQ